MTRAPTTRPRRPAPEPLDVNSTGVIVVGTGLWFVAFLVLRIAPGALFDGGDGRWLWATLAGWVLGVAGLALSWRQRRPARRRLSRRHGPAGPASLDADNPIGGL